MTQLKNEQNGSTTQNGSSLGSTGSSLGSTGSSPGSSGTKSGIAGLGEESRASASDPAKSTERLREDIARTRSALSQDMAALGSKLSPDQLKEDAKEVLHHASTAAREGARDMVRDAKDAAIDSLRHAKDHAFESISEEVREIGSRARAAGHDVSDFVATHAVPLALVGVGAGWLLVSMSHQRRLSSGGYRRSGDYVEGSYGYDQGSERVLGRARDRAEALAGRATRTLTDGRERIAGRAHELADRAHQIEERVVERAGELRSQLTDGVSHLGEQASDLGHRAYQGVERAGRGAVRVSERNPLATGLLVMAAGVAAGILLPGTRREDQWLGGTRDRLLDKAQRSATELKESVQHGASEVRGALSEMTQPPH